MENEPIRVRVRKDFAELLCRPFRSWMTRHVVVENSSRTDLHGDENVQDAERGRDCHEEVASDDRPRMIPNECGPTLITSAVSRPFGFQILPNSSWRDLNAKFQH